MLFNSYEFIFVFLPITFFIYFYLNHKRLTIASKGFLVFSSLFFYSWWNIAYLPLILISMLFNYLIGNSLNKDIKENKKNFSKKSILIFGIVANLLLLGYFKYADFFIENINFISGVNLNLLHMVLPLAISFFTFQQIAYLVDSYKNLTKEYDFSTFNINDHNFLFGNMKATEIEEKKKEWEEHQKTKASATVETAAAPSASPKPIFKPKIKPTPPTE